MPRSRLVVFTASGTWTKDPKLYAIKIIGRGPGGGGSWPTGNGNGYGGGGGGASKTQRRIAARELPATVDVVIGPPGVGGKSSSRNGTSGGDCSFGTFLRVGGGKGATITSVGMGGDGVDRGGNGGTPGSAGQSKPLRPSDYLRAPGGGAGGGSTGGSSGVVPAGQSSPTLWQTTRSGGGGNSGGAGGFPGGGGGGGQAPSVPAGSGGGGCITVIEYLYDEE
ncbi:hypothetical protein ACFVWF_32670 [Rhodococcus qingshengii]|uniref:glycine-rich domain-containing protein n=1 Tax=Rhodococcus qingshengii TaxID=334542 RepID=UPI0036DEEB7B